MNLLAVNTSGFSASLALGTGVDTQSQPSAWSCIDLNQDQNTAQFLVPAIRELLNSADIRLEEIDRFAVASGPGSFTGLRIGVTTIKTLSYATGKEIYGINSLAAIAQNAKSEGLWSAGKLAVIINAYRRQFFQACFEWDSFDNSFAHADELTSTIEHPDLEDLLQTGQQFAGPGISSMPPGLRNAHAARMLEFEFAESARGVGELAVQLDSKSSQTPFSLLPKYFRASAAEEKMLPDSKQ